MAEERVTDVDEAHDREAILRHLEDPRVKELIRQAFAEAGKASGEPGVTAEELPQFLREHGL